MPQSTSSSTFYVLTFYVIIKWHQKSMTSVTGVSVSIAIPCDYRRVMKLDAYILLRTECNYVPYVFSTCCCFVLKCSRSVRYTHAEDFVILDYLIAENYNTVVESKPK
jgi:hypothetical protein